MKTLRCDQCASTDLTRLGEHEYRCNHCKTQMHTQAKPAPHVVVVRPTTPAPKPSKLRGVVLVILGIALLGVAASLKAQRQARAREALRQRALQRDIARRIEARMGNNSLDVNDLTGGHLAGQRSGGSPPPQPNKPVEYGSDSVVAPKAVLATFTDAVAVPDRIGNIYFIGVYKNTGEAAIDHPRVEATLWDAKKEKLAVGAGFAPFMNLLPGEEVPVKILVQHAPAYESVTYHVAPQAVRIGSPARFKTTIEKPKLEPAAFGGYRLSGQVRNNDRSDVQFVHIVALLRDSKRSIVGMIDGFPGQRQIPAGDFSPFSLQGSTLRGTPSTFVLYTFASPIR